MIALSAILAALRNPIWAAVLSASFAGGYGYIKGFHHGSDRATRAHAAYVAEQAAAQKAKVVRADRARSAVPKSGELRDKHRRD